MTVVREAVERMQGSLALRMVAAALVLVVAPAAAQVNGMVVDDMDGTPISGVLIVLSDAAGTEISRTLATEAGSFTVRPPVSGFYFIGAHALGYESVVGLEVVVDASAVAPLEISMRRDPLAVDPVTVTAERRRRRLEAVGFYRREEMGIGRFIGTEEIEERAMDRLSDALRIEPSVLIRPILKDGSNSYHVSFRGTFRQGDCEPTFVLDGVKLGGNILLDEVVHPANVLALELYPRSHGVPAQWSGYDAGCGVILIWTKRHEP